MFLNTEILKARQRRGGKESLVERIEAAFVTTFEPDRKSKLRRRVVQNEIMAAMGEPYTPTHARAVSRVLLNHGVIRNKIQGSWFYRVRRRGTR